MFKIITNTLEGAVQATINTVKVPIGVVIAPLDDGQTIADAVEGVKDGVKKIGSDRK